MDWRLANREWKVDGAVNKVLFANKYKEIHFVLPDTSHMYYIQVEDVLYRRRNGWVKYAQCDVPIVEEDDVIIFLAVTLMQKKKQEASIQIMQPEPSNQKDEVQDPNYPDGEELNVLCSYSFFIK